MCGIAGWLDNSVGSGEAASARLQRMCDSMRHRGPDDDGTFLREGVALGLRRLSIVDIAGGHQPMHSSGGAISLIFNGEIYNHAELRQELKAQGADFKTRSDTEVLLRLYERDGLAGLGRLNGMFAIALWDERDQSLHLIRDRLGVKPLYYAWDGQRLLFASEIKAILAAMPVRPAVNPQAMWDYFTFRFVPSPQTIWKGIYKLPPAHHLTLRKGTNALRIARWWDIPKPNGALIHDSEAIERFDALLSDSTRLRMLADVPVGVLLSGGIDSSVIAARARHNGDALHTFSIAFEGADDIDERPFARQVARHLKAEHRELVIDHRHVIDFLPDFVHFADEPLGDAVCIPLNYLCRLARESVTVVLAGEGADEILGGYSFDLWAQKRDEAVALVGADATSSTDGPPELNGFHRSLFDLRHADPPPSMTNYMSFDNKRDLFKVDVGYGDSHRSTRQALLRYGDASPLAQALYVYCQDWLVEDLLMKADKMSMATSVELRTPFLDYRVVEAAARLPDHLRVGRNEDGQYETKRILRQLARRGEIPLNIVERPKMGFPQPIYDWLGDPARLRPFVIDHLTGPNVRLREWCEDKALAEIIALGTAQPGKRRHQHILYNALIMEMWLKHWV